MRGSFAILAAFLGAVGCRTPLWTGGHDLPTKAPESEGLDPQRLASMKKSLARRQTHALLVMRHGESVLEWYADGYGPDSLHFLASLSKTLVGGLSLLLALEDGVVYHTYSTYSRGVDAIWSMYPWLDRAPHGRNETGLWWRRHDEYAVR